MCAWFTFALFWSICRLLSGDRQWGSSECPTCWSENCKNWLLYALSYCQIERSAIKVYLLVLTFQIICILRHSSRQQHIEYWVDPANQWHWLVEKEISRTLTILGRREKNKTIIDAKARFKEQIANISWCTAYSPVWSAKLQLIRYFINIYILPNSHIDIFKEVHINIFKNDRVYIT